MSDIGSEGRERSPMSAAATARRSVAMGSSGSPVGVNLESLTVDTQQGGGVLGIKRPKPHKIWCGEEYRYHRVIILIESLMYRAWMWGRSMVDGPFHASYLCMDSSRETKHIKLLVVGDSGLGKTTLIRSLVSTPGERLKVIKLTPAERQGSRGIQARILKMFDKDASMTVWLVVRPPCCQNPLDVRPRIPSGSETCPLPLPPNKVHDGSNTPVRQFVKDPESLCSTISWRDEEDRVIWIYKIQV